MPSPFEKSSTLHWSSYKLMWMLGWRSGNTLGESMRTGEILDADHQGFSQPSPAPRGGSTIGTAGLILPYGTADPELEASSITIRELAVYSWGH
jgi:hypothetical protein